MNMNFISLVSTKFIRYFVSVNVYKCHNIMTLKIHLVRIKLITAPQETVLLNHPNMYCTHTYYVC